MLAQSRRIHIADAVFSHPWGDDEFQRPFEPLELDRGIGEGLCALERRDRGLRLSRRRLPGLNGRFDEAAHRVGMLLRESGRGEQDVGIEIHAMVAQHHHIDVVLFDAESAQGWYRGHHPGGPEVDFAANEHGLAHLRLHVRPLHARGIDAVHASEHIEQPVGGVNGRCATLASHQIARLLDACLLERNETKRRLVIDQQYRDQLAAGISRVELHHGGKIAEADVVRTARDLGDRIGATTPGIECGQVYVLSGVIAALAAEHERGLLALQQEVEHEADVGGLRARRDGGDECGQQQDGRRGHGACAHRISSC